MPHTTEVARTPTQLADAPHPAHRQREPERRPWSLLALLAVAQFMVILDITIVNVALPSIGRALKFARTDLQWVVTAYVLCSGGLVLIGGRAADLFGRRRIFLAGLILFTTASLLSGVAPSPGTLIAARAAQGIGAAMLTPSALSIVTSYYTGAQRATALSIWGAIASAGIAVGVVAGGMITTWLTWRWVFLVNVPVGALAAITAARVLPPFAPLTARRKLDVLGAATVIAGLATLVYGVSGAPDHGWGSLRTIGLLVAAFVLLAAFAFVETRATDPLVPPATWRARPLTAGSTIMLGATGILAGAFFLLSVFMQNVLHFSALHTGLALLPFVASTALGVHATSHAIAKTGSRPLIVSGLALAGGAALLLSGSPANADYWTDVLPGLLMLGVGMGLTFPAASITAMSEAGADATGLASGVMSSAHEVGAALGVSILSAVAVGASAAFATGAGVAFTVAAIIAGALGLAAAVIVPSVRPAPGTQINIH
jgi:EmrB/QacA subfamily drug resistance transporter